MAIVVGEHVWKRFRIPHERRVNFLDHLARALSVLEGKRYNYEEFWALKDVSFELQRGESLGIVGPNGSGKSTLLKVIAGIMKPDRGIIKTKGSVAPILELGIGFHGDLTVKENAMVYGVIMGLRRSEMTKRVESILDFSGLSKFQDAKLKNLSSGMQVRLAFSIAIQSEADIFLVDEALSVGDMEFQEKCLERFRQLKEQNVTIVLVSHNTDLVDRFCDKGLYLSNGEPGTFGTANEATSQYLKDMKSSAQTSKY